MNYMASKFLLLAHIIIRLLYTIFPLFSTYTLKCLLDIISVRDSNIKSLWIWIGLYVLTVILLHALGSVQNICSDAIFKRAENL